MELIAAVGTKLKKTPTQEFSCELYEIFKNTYFEEHLEMAALNLTCIIQIKSRRDRFISRLLITFVTYKLQKHLVEIFCL